MKSRFYLGVALLTGNLHLQAQQLGLEYDTELQTDFKGGYNWANLLIIHAEADLTPKLNLQATTISVARTNDQPLVDDLQGYSNIEEENLPLGIAVLGAEYRHRQTTFFLGIRNVNEDYFTSPVTSLFVNSSCGIFPTISGNYDIANYPLSSWCLHFKTECDNLTVQSSVFEGRGHRRIAGEDNVFSFSPKRNGVFSITSAEYDNNGSNYSVGCALYYGVHHSDEDGIKEVEAFDETTRKKMSVAPWINVEQRLSQASSLMLQASYSTAKTNCRYYFGIGSTYTVGKARLGVFADHAKFKTCSETAAELTCRISLTPNVYLQPTLEAIHCRKQTDVIGIMRLSVAI